MFLQANYSAHYFKPLIWLIGFVVTTSLCTFLCVIEPYCCPKQKKSTPTSHSGALGDMFSHYHAHMQSILF